MGTVTRGRDRTPKQDRSRATRQRLLEAAVTCLAEHGWSGQHGLRRRRTRRRLPGRRPAPLPAPARTCSRRPSSTSPRSGRAPCGSCSAHGARTARATARAVVAALVDLYTGPLFRAALHLWVAASDEEQLRPRVTALEARVGREAHRFAVDLLGADESRAGRPGDRPGPARHGPRPGPRQPPDRRHHPPPPGRRPVGRPVGRRPGVTTRRRVRCASAVRECAGRTVRAGCQPAIVSCMRALAVCMRFSDWSKTRLCLPSKTSSSTSQMSGWAIAVSVSSRWKAGRQCR